MPASTAQRSNVTPMRRPAVAENEARELRSGLEVNAAPSMTKSPKTPRAPTVGVTNASPSRAPTPV